MKKKNSILVLIVIGVLTVGVLLTGCLINHSVLARGGADAAALAASDRTAVIVSVLMLLIVAGTVFAALKVFRKQRDEIAEAKRAKTDFLFNISHDIRTPMNAVLGYANQAQRHADEPSRVRDALVKLQCAGMHMVNLINDILDMTRIERGTVEISETMTDLMRFNENIGPILEAAAISKSIDYRASIRNVQNRYVYLDRLHVNRILINLVTNAIKYTPDGGKVSLTLEQAGPEENGVARFSFKVSDTGIGISDEFKEHLFEEFSRERSSTVSGKEGAGLGLAITKHLVDRMNGTISVESKPGKGSVFTVILPLRTAAEMEDLEEDDFDEEDLAFLSGKRILLVEDNTFNREIARELLEDAGVLVEEVEDGQAAVDIVFRHGLQYYDLVLMDIQMPVMDGYEATRRIRQLPDAGHHLPIVALSANAFEEDRIASREAGMDAHIAKPIELRELREALQAALGEK